MHNCLPIAVVIELLKMGKYKVWPSLQLLNRFSNKISCLSLYDILAVSEPIPHLSSLFPHDPSNFARLKLVETRNPRLTHPPPHSLLKIVHQVLQQLIARVEDVDSRAAACTVSLWLIPSALEMVCRRRSDLGPHPPRQAMCPYHGAYHTLRY